MNEAKSGIQTWKMKGDSALLLWTRRRKKQGNKREFEGEKGLSSQDCKDEHKVKRGTEKKNLLSNGSRGRGGQTSATEREEKKLTHKKEGRNKKSIAMVFSRLGREARERNEKWSK